MVNTNKTIKNITLESIKRTQFESSLYLNRIVFIVKPSDI